MPHYTTRELSGQKSELEGGCGDGKIYGNIGVGQECGYEREGGQVRKVMFLTFLTF